MIVVVVVVVVVGGGGGGGRGGGAGAGAGAVIGGLLVTVVSVCLRGFRAVLLNQDLASCPFR